MNVAREGDHFLEEARLASKASNARSSFESTPFSPRTALRTAWTGLMLGFVEEDTAIPSNRQNSERSDPGGCQLRIGPNVESLLTRFVPPVRRERCLCDEDKI